MRVRLVVRKRAMTVLALLTLAALDGCGGDGIEGTYHGPNDMVTLELKSGGRASFSAMGETQECTYEATREAVFLRCDEAGDPLQIQRNPDGTLDAGLMGTLSKRKS